jgi:hypothetical protein
LKLSKLAGRVKHHFRLNDTTLKMWPSLINVLMSYNSNLMSPYPKGSPPMEIKIHENAVLQLIA